MFEKDFYLFTELESLLNCSKADIQSIAGDDRFPYYLKTKTDWWTWNFSNSENIEPSQGVFFVGIDNYSGAVQDIFKDGSATLDVFDNAYVSSNRFLPELGVSASYDQLAISREDVIVLTSAKKPSSIYNWNNNCAELGNGAKLQSTTERQTMLKLIIGMAIDAYGYDPLASKNLATGDKNGISAALATRGISIDSDTIRKYLTEARELL